MLALYYLFIYFLKYVIIIYALGSAHEKFDVWIWKPIQSRNSRLSQAGRTAEPFRTETAVFNLFIPAPNFLCTLFKVLRSAHEKFGVWTGPNKRKLSAVFCAAD